MSKAAHIDWWRRSLPRSWNIAVALLVAVFAALVFTHAGVSHVYLKYFGAKSPRIAVDYAGLSNDMDEKAALAHFAPLALRCMDEPKEINRLGDRVCHAALDAADEVPALTLALFFDSGKLAHATIHVPWWAHHRLAKTLVEKLGAPEALNLAPVAGNRLIQWRVKGGVVVFNRDPGWDPLDWSAVYWQPQPPGRRP
ncbi:MAG: hypothetical protein V4787_00655 [Pseudomonadota bacterium]